jgi:nucleotide-binding universal stress UspA family protein
MLSIRTILHPTDFSDSSKQAFQLACSLARDHGARLVVVHVVPEPRVPLGGIMTPPPAEDYPEVKKQLQEIRATGPKIRIDRRLAVGDPVREICRLAKNTKTRLIVMGTHGRKGLNRFLMGSVAEQVVRKAECPVLTVRLPIRIVRRRKVAAVM